MHVIRLRVPPEVKANGYEYFLEGQYHTGRADGRVYKVTHLGSGCGDRVRANSALDSCQVLAAAAVLSYYAYAIVKSLVSLLPVTAFVTTRSLRYSPSREGLSRARRGSHTVVQAKKSCDANPQKKYFR